MAPKLPPPANTKAVFAAEWSDTDKETVAPATRVGGTRGVLAEFIAGDWRGVPQPPSSSPRTRGPIRCMLLRRVVATAFARQKAAAMGPGSRPGQRLISSLRSLVRDDGEISVPRTP